MKIYIKDKITGKIDVAQANDFFSLSKNIRDLNDEATQEEADLFILNETKDTKIQSLKELRDVNLIKETPQTINYSGNLLNKQFKLGKEDLSTFNVIIDMLKEQIIEGNLTPTRKWTDATGDRLDLDIEDFKSLRNHLLNRDEQEYDQYKLKKDEINSIRFYDAEIDPIENEETTTQTIQRVKDYDINQVII